MSIFKKIFIIFQVILGITGCTQNKSDHLTLFDPGQAIPGQVRSFNGDQVSIKDGNVLVNFSAGKPSSTIAISPANGLWDASDFRFVRCEIENMGTTEQLVELGFGNYDLTLGATIVPPKAKKTLKAVIYRTEHPAYIDSLFPVMHGKPDGTLRGWMASTNDSIEYIKLIFQELKPDACIRIGKIWLEKPYTLYPAEVLKEKYYPFVDQFGQYRFDEWPDKIHSSEDLLAHDAREIKELENMSPVSEWDEYGGWAKGPELRATGRFRVEKVNGKWWFVDPDGKLFWSNGIDEIRIGESTRISEREHYFQYLPEKGNPEAGLYSYSGGTVDTIKWLSFYELNIFRKYGESYKEIFWKRIHKRLRNWGMNTIGNWSDQNIYLQHKTPYVLTTNSLKTGLIADPYAPGFQKDLENRLKSKKEELRDPWCLGVFVDNELKWGVKWVPKIPEQILTASPNQPAKVVFANLMKSKYLTINELNKEWGTSFADWKGLLENTSMIPKAAEDMRDFMKEFSSLYFSKCRAAVKETDPEMLYLGCRMDFHLYPEDTTLNYIIKIASEYCDVVSFNRYRYTCSELIPPDGGDYPIIIGEFHFGSLETGLLQPGLRYAADQMERTAFFEHYLRDALNNPYMVGAHWFQLVDQPVTGRSDGENYQAGFLTVGDIPQEGIISKSRELGYNMYRIRTNIK